MSPNHYTLLAIKLAETQEVLAELELRCKQAKNVGLQSDALAMQGIVARMARNSWALMDETQQIRTAQRLTKHQPIQ